MNAPSGTCVSFLLWFVKKKQTHNLVTSPLNLFTFKALTPYHEKNGLIEKKNLQDDH